jgi:hypothetical protein
MGHICIGGVALGQDGGRRHQPDGGEDPADPVLGPASHQHAADHQEGSERQREGDIFARVLEEAAVDHPEGDAGGVADQAERQQPPAHRGRTRAYRTASPSRSLGTHSHYGQRPTA